MKSKSEKAVRVEPNPWSKTHKTETRIFAREIHESYCAQRGCRFHGRPAVQGVCHTRQKGFEAKYLARAEARASQLLDELRAIAKRAKHTQKQYAKTLENHLFCVWMNADFSLDELVRTRGENAVLKDKLRLYTDLVGRPRRAPKRARR